MESAYLKSAVGEVLAKGIADTIVAQPANPQEHLALYLLHHLQEEERRADMAAQRRSADEMRAEYAGVRATQEKFAADTLQRGLSAFRARLAERKEAEAALAALYEEAEEEADELLESAPSGLPAEDEEEGGGGNTNGGNGEEEGAGGLAGPGPAELAEQLEEARAAFYRAQRFMHTLDKAHLGRLKEGLVDMKERVRIGRDAAHKWTQRVAAEEREAEEAALDPTRAPPQLSAAAAALAARLQQQREHTRLSLPLTSFRVLRCLCYLLYNATPKATDTPEKVAAVLKPTVTVQLLRAFNPVATYTKGRPLRLEDAVPREDGDGDDAGGPDGGNNNGAEEEGEAVPVPQPKPRQVRRAGRVLRVLSQDLEYFDTLDPEDFIDEEELEEQPQLQEQSATAKAAKERRAQVLAFVETEAKTRGGVALFALMRLARTAVAYRQARDAWVAARRARGLEVPDTFEAPEEEEEDPLNEEALVDEDGEVDKEAVAALLGRVGTDDDETLAKLWEGKDRRARDALAAAVRAIAKRREADEVEEEEQ